MLQKQTIIPFYNIATKVLSSTTKDILTSMYILFSEDDHTYYENKTKIHSFQIHKILKYFLEEKHIKIEMFFFHF